ncbi:hypothetical protein PsalN5692_01812 [Piscirickettsia salmonis]|nr:hypothetical protein PsalN5692_01812 [Piscirickettsia salmonis]
MELRQRQTRMLAADFMGHLIQAVPYKIHTVLTDNGVQFTNHKHNKCALKHIFDRVCESYDIALNE